MVHLHQNKSMKTLIVSVFKESAGLDGNWRLHKYHIQYFGLHFSNIGRVQINVSWFGKYNAFFIFHNSFSHLPRKSWYQRRFLFSKPRDKNKIFLAAKVKNDLNMIRISFLLKQLYCCCLDIRFFSLILIGVNFCNSFSFMSFFFCALFYSYWTLI